MNLSNDFRTIARRIGEREFEGDCLAVLWVQKESKSIRYQAEGSKSRYKAIEIR